LLLCCWNLLPLGVLLTDDDLTDDELHPSFKPLMLQSEAVCIRKYERGKRNIRLDLIFLCKPAERQPRI
jgi:hypothetical protein